MSRNIALVEQFLRTELMMSSEAIEIALRQWEREQGPLPTILWRYGLVTTEQLHQVFLWLSRQP